MRKSLIIISFLVLPFLAFSQNDDDEDSSYYDYDYVKDTTSTFHIGFAGGANIQSLFYSKNEGNLYSDSISYSSSTPQIGYTFGIIIENDFSDKWWFKSGVYVSISKLNLNYSYRNQTNYTFNHSTLEVPLWFQYAFKDIRKGASWGMGIKGSFDITRSEDRDRRLYEMHRAELLLGTGPTMRWQMGSGKFINLSLGINASVFNLFAENNSAYNQTMNWGRRWQLQILLALD